MRSRVIGAVIGGVGAILAVALLAGNQWSVDAITRHDLYTNDKIGPLAQYLTFPSWRVSPLRAAVLLPADVGTLAFLVFTALLIVPAVRSIVPRTGAPGRPPVPVGAGGGEVRGGAFGALVCGWWATVVAGALAGLVRGVVLNALEPLPGMSWRFTWSSLGSGAGFGLFFGWLVGLGVLIGLGRRRAHPAFPPPGVPAPAAPYAPPGPPTPAAPYAPPQPGWGAPPPQPGFGEVPATPPPTARPLPPGPAVQAAPPPSYVPDPEPDPAEAPHQRPERGRSEDRTLDPEPWRREPGPDPS
ncbi:hypothetical protein [Actinoallomurus soli]|uniref:hypothetical protein n=1 Tax=Actinoallomurus soli TaxID=2952535 RepID=UPI00273A74E9|nr:hypothetical protein [Actinoallomurus soli]